MLEKNITGILNGLSVAVFIVDAAQTIQFRNAAATSLFGTGMQGSKLSSFVPNKRCIRAVEDVIDGDIHRDHDLEALHATLTALNRGYRIFRIPIAKRMGVSATELDKRVTEILRTWLSAMALPRQ